MRHLRLLGLLLAVFAAVPVLAWAPPTPAELHMKAPAEDPGANAVYLSWDEDDNDRLNDHTVTVRLKMLTRAGVERYADVEIGTLQRRFSVEAIEARTIHEDGAVIPFTGKPFVKTVRLRGESYRATVFSMPDVQPGSILEYRYRLRYADDVVMPARWYVQQQAYALREHYIFRPLDLSGARYVVLDHGKTSQGLFYTNNLPKEAEHASERGRPLEISLHLSAANFSKRAGPMLLVRPAVVGMYTAAGVDGTKPRLYPIALGEEETVREEYTIQQPPGYRADDLPDLVKLDSPFAVFRNLVTLEGGALHYRRELTVRALKLPASEAVSYREFFATVANAERAEAVLKPGS